MVLLIVLELKTNNAKLTQKQIANELRFSFATGKRSRNDLNLNRSFNDEKRFIKRSLKMRESNSMLIEAVETTFKAIDIH